VRSTPGAGTTFEVLLPIAPHAVQHSVGAQEAQIKPQ
jgi:hypothetical protein